MPCKILPFLILACVCSFICCDKFKISFQQLQCTPQHLVSLRHIITDGAGDMAVRQVASIYFKNFVAKNWSPHEAGMNDESHVRTQTTWLYVKLWHFYCSFQGSLQWYQRMIRWWSDILSLILLLKFLLCWGISVIGLAVIFSPWTPLETSSNGKFIFQGATFAYPCKDLGFFFLSLKVIYFIGAHPIIFLYVTF